ETWPPVRRRFLEGPVTRIYAHLSFLVKSSNRHFQKLKKLPPTQWVPYLIDKRKIVTEMISTRDIYRGDSWAMYRDWVSAANFRVYSRYVPKPYEGKVWLFLAAARPVGTRRDQRVEGAAATNDPRLEWVGTPQDPRLEWGKLAKEGYATFRI